MKKLALLAALTLMSATSAFAASATVTLNSYDADKSIFYLDAGTLAGADTFVQLLGGPVGGALLPVNVAGKTDTVFALDGGYFDAGYGVVPGVAATANADFQLVAWKGAGNTYDTATERGASATWTQATGSWDAAAQPPPAPSGPVLAIPAGFGIVAVPEPSTIALGLIGAAALLIRRRK